MPRANFSETPDFNFDSRTTRLHPVSDPEPSRSRQLPAHQYSLFVQALTEMACHRLAAIRDYAENYLIYSDSSVTPVPKYDRLRAETIFHMRWVFDDDGDQNRSIGWIQQGNRITFRDLCGLVELDSGCQCGSIGEKFRKLTIDEAREGLIRLFTPNAINSLLSPISPKLLADAAARWIGHGPKSIKTHRGGRRKDEQVENQVVEAVNDVAMLVAAGANWDEDE